MSEKTYASEAGHWYWPDGRTCYTYQAKDGSEKNTTKREARKWGLYPSFSEIEGCADKPGLNNWKQDKQVEICHAHPPLPDEPLEDYRKRVRRLDREERAKAPDLGSLIHGCIEKHLLKVSYDQTYSNHVVGALDAVRDWCGLDGLCAEKSFAHPLGYGGKCDIHKKVPPFANFIADFKTKDFGEEWKPETWDNHAMQLAAYREGLEMPDAKGAIIFVSTKVPKLTRLVEVPQDELEKGWRMFCALLTYWQEKNGFFPNI